MRRSYQVAERKDSQALSEFLASEGQLLLPMVQLIEDAELAVDEVIDVVGRATIEAVLQLSRWQGGSSEASVVRTARLPGTAASLG